MGVSKKLGYGLLLLAAMGTTVMIIILAGLGKLHDRFAQATQVEGPAMLASQEMELNNNGIGLSVLAYLEHGSATLSANVARDIDDFRANLAIYRELTRNDTERTHAVEITQWFSHYSQLASQLIALSDRSAQARASLYSGLERLDKLLESYASPLAESPAEIRQSPRILALSAEAELAELRAEIRDYHDRSTEAARTRIEKRLKALSALFRGMRAATAESRSRASLSVMERANAALTGAVSEILRMEDEKTHMQQAFLQLRDRIDQAIDQRVQPTLHERYLLPYQEGEAASERVYTWTFALIPAYLTLTALVGCLLFGWIARPIKRLHAAAEAVSAGKWNVTVAVKGHDEFGGLATAFNNMLTNLRSTTVSRDRLENSEAILRTIVEQLQGEISMRKRMEIERLRMENEARRSEKLAAIGTLVAGVAHEVRNPLFGVSSTLDAMRARFADDSRLERYLDVLKREIARLNRLMSDLLDYGKPVESESGEADLDSTIHEAVAACAPLAARREVTIQSEIDSSPIRVCMNTPRIVQALINVIENALHHAPSGSIVAIRTELVQRESIAAVACTIRDQGPGFPMEDLPRVFEPFYSRRRGGTGLGLAIVSRIAEEHGGWVNARNADGGGAEVTLSFPCDRRIVPTPPLHGAPLT